MKVLSYSKIKNFDHDVIQQNGITKLEILVCINLWIGSYYVYLFAHLIYVWSFRWFYLDTTKHDYNTRGKKDASTFKDA